MDNVRLGAAQKLLNVALVGRNPPTLTIARLRAVVCRPPDQALCKTLFHLPDSRQRRPP